MKHLLVIGIFTLSGFSIRAQESFKAFNELLIGTSLTFIAHEDDFGNSGSSYTVLYKEFTWHLNLAAYVAPRWRLGVQNMQVWGVEDFYGFQSRVSGMLAQYEFFQQPDHRAFFELSGNHGNYCPCGDDFPYRKENLYYIGSGLGFDWELSKLVHLDLAFYAYYTLNEPQASFAYTQYIVGVDFHIPLRKRSGKMRLFRIE